MNNKLRILTVSLVVMCVIMFIACVGKEDKDKGQPQVQQNAPQKPLPPPQNVQNNPVPPWPLPPSNVQNVPPQNVQPSTDNVFKIETRLTNDDPKDRVRQSSVHKGFSMKMAAGAVYRIDLMSREFDAYLRLEDSTGKELAHDDDGGDGLNARITFQAPKDDIYRIIATTFKGGTGNFVMTVRPQGKESISLTLIALPPKTPLVNPDGKSKPDTPDLLIKLRIESLNVIADTLATIRDKQTAEDAKEKVKTQADRIQDLRKRYKALAVADNQQNKFDPKEFAVVNRIDNEHLRLRELIKTHFNAAYAIADVLKYVSDGLHGL